MISDVNADIHGRLRLARAAHQQAEHDLAVLLFELSTSRRYTERGHTSVEAYAEAELDLTARQTRDLVAVARHMRVLPALALAFRDGRLSYTKAREVVRVATPETDAAWTQRACNTTSRALERQVVAASRGDAPPAADFRRPAQPGPARVTLRFEMSAAQADVLRAAMTRLRLEGGFGTDVDDGALLGDLARNALRTMEQAAAGERQAPTAERFRVTLRHCPSCQETHVGDPQAPSRADATDAACAACDAEVLDLTDDVPSADVWPTAATPPAPLTHAIPPATRRRVFEQYGHRCAVPHCRNRLWLDLHHIRPRHAGGDHRADNLVCLCSQHHALLHEGAIHLIAVGDTGGDGDGDPRGLRFALPTGEILGERREDTPTIEALARQVEGALADAPGRSGRALVRDWGADAAFAAVALDTLRALGRAVVTPDERWFPAGVVLQAAGR